MQHCVELFQCIEKKTQLVSRHQIIIHGHGKYKGCQGKTHDFIITTTARVHSLSSPRVICEMSRKTESWDYRSAHQQRHGELSANPTRPSRASTWTSQMEPRPSQNHSWRGGKEGTYAPSSMCSLALHHDDLYVSSVPTFTCQRNRNGQEPDRPRSH